MPNGRQNQGRKAPRKAAASSTQPRDVAPMLRVPRSLQHKHIRTYDFGALTPTASDKGWAFTFLLSALPNHTEFTNLYDQYKIECVEVIWELIPTVEIGTAAVATMACPVILAWQDNDDGSTPATLNEVNQIAKMERLQLSVANPAVKRSVLPWVQAGTPGAPANVGLSIRAPYIDCSQDGVQHYSIKFWVKNFTTTTVSLNGLGINLAFRYHLSMRNPR